MATNPTSPRDVEFRIDEDRRALGTTIDRLRVHIRERVNLRRQVSENIGAACALALVAGLLAGRLIRTFI
jgi:hypothetical protein